MDNDAKKDLFSSVLHLPGEEPEELRQRINRLFSKLDTAYPDKVISDLTRDHKKWSESVTKLYRELGYPDRKAFLSAYGYTVVVKAGGRPSLDHNEVINELKRRYADGPTCSTTSELSAANSDLAPRFKNLQNQAEKLFGMTFTKYLIEEGILIGKSDQQCEEAFATLKSRYADTPFDGTLNELKAANPDVDWDAIKTYYTQSKSSDPFRSFLVNAGILKQQDASAETKLAEITSELKKRYPEGKGFSGNLEALKCENSDLPMGNLNAWTMKVHKLTARAYLVREGIILSDESNEDPIIFSDLSAPSEQELQRIRNVENTFKNQIYRSDEIDGNRLERAKELSVNPINAMEFQISGGKNVHNVICFDSGYFCDCPDFAERPKNCKHILAVRLRQNAADPAAIRLTLPRSAGLAVRLEEFVTKAQERYEGRELYFLNLLELENSTLNLKNISQWSKKVVGMNIRQYLLSLGILKETVYFEKEKAWPDVAELVGKNCCLLCKKAETEKALWADCGIRIVGPESEEIDYLYLDYGQQVRAIPPDENEVAYQLFKERQEGKRSFVVLHQSYYYVIRNDIENRRLCKRYTPEERAAMGLFVYKDRPPADKANPTAAARIQKKISPKDLPVYQADQVYWTLQEHSEWMSMSGGEIRCSDTKDYTRDPKQYTSEAVVRWELERFQALCAAVTTPAVAEYIVKKVGRATGPVVIAPFRFTPYMRRYYALVAQKGTEGQIVVSVELRDLVRYVGDCDYKELRNLERRVDPKLWALMKSDAPEAFPYRGKAGYLYIDSKDGVIPELAFANDPTIEYVELSDRITTVGCHAFRNCPNLKEIRFGKQVQELGTGAFGKCVALQTLTIPEGVQTVWASEFSDCSALTDLYLFGDEKCMEHFSPLEGVMLHVFPGTPVERYCMENNLNYQTFLPK